MSLDALFRPKSVAVIGASSDANRIGGRPIAFSKRAFAGAIVPINPNRSEIQGLAAYPSIMDAPGEIDQAIIAVPAKAALQAADECIAKGVKAAVMFSSGFAETGADGRALQQELARRCAAGGMTLLGPNSLGMFNVHAGLYSTFSSYFDPLWPRTGPVGIVSQSGAFGTYFLAQAVERGLGFSHFVATGNEAGVDVAACVEWLADDPDDLRDHDLSRGLPRRRAPACRARAGGAEPEAGDRHEGRRVGAGRRRDRVAHRIARRLRRGVRCRVLPRTTCIARNRSTNWSTSPTPARAECFRRSPRLGVVTLSGGVGIQMADAAVERGLTLPRMPDSAQQKVLAMVPFAGPANPVDTTAQVVNDWTMFTTILGIVAEEGAVDSVVSFLAHMGTMPGLMDRLKSAFLDVRKRFPDRVFVLCARMPREMADDFTAMGFLIFEDPTRAIAAVAALSRFAQGFGRTRASAVAPAAATPLPRGPINEADAKRLLGAAGIPFAPEKIARSRTEAVAAAGEIGFPVVLKVLSPDIAHKSEAGGVVLGLRNADEVAAGYDAMMARVAAHAPQAKLEGALVARMIAGGVETVIGAKRDAMFGPVVMFGLGGVYVEVLKDVTLRLAPVDRAAAQRDDPRHQGHRAAHRRARQAAGRSRCARRRAGRDVAVCRRAS